MKFPARLSACVMSALLFASGCQSGAPREPEIGEAVRAGHLIPFTPISTVSSIHFADGRYPALFSPKSSCVWASGHSLTPLALPEAPVVIEAPVNIEAAPASPHAAASDPAPLISSAPLSAATPETTAPPPVSMPPAAPAPTPGTALPPAPPARNVSAPASEPAALYDNRFAVFECRMTSAFADMSISYDAVGFNGIHVYMETPDGQQVEPSELRMGKDLQETQSGALKEYTRINQVVFAREALRLVVPEGGGYPPLRLVLEGHGCKFYFEWIAELPQSIGPPPVAQSEAAQRTRETLKKSREKVQGWSHTLD